MAMPKCPVEMGASSALMIELVGALAGILVLGKKERPLPFGSGAQITLVAGVGFEPTTFRL